MVWTPFSIRFCSSKLSTRSVFHTMPGKKRYFTVSQSHNIMAPLLQRGRMNCKQTETGDKVVRHLCQRSWCHPGSGKRRPSCRILPSERSRYGTLQRGPAWSVRKGRKRLIIHVCTFDCLYLHFCQTKHFQVICLIHDVRSHAFVWMFLCVPSACWAWSRRFSGFRWRTSACPGWPQTPLLHWAPEGTASLLERKQNTRVSSEARR